MVHKIYLWIIIVALQAAVFNCFAQESELWLRNGKKLTINSYVLDNSDYYDGKITYKTINGKEKSKYLEDVFSVVEKNGKETVFYTQNVEFGEILTPEQMKQYVIGIGDARSTLISPLIGIGGVFSGLLGAFIPQPQIKMGDNTLPLPVGVFVPATYITVMGATAPNADKLQQKFPEKADNEHYLMGYQEGIKKKRIKNSLIGSAFGFIVGVFIVVSVN